MGGVFNCCKKTKKKKQNVEFSKKEDKLQIFEFSRQGQKKNKDEVGQDAYELLINSELIMVSIIIKYHKRVQNVSYIK